MLKSLAISSLCFVAASAGLLACTPAEDPMVIRVGTGGNGANPTGSGGATGSGGTTATGSGGTVGSGGSTGSGGAMGGGGMAGPGSGGQTAMPGSGGSNETGGSGMTGSGGAMGGGGRGGTMGGSGGAAPPAGTGGAMGTAGAGGTANMVVLYDGSAASFNGWASIRNANNPNPWRNNADGTMTVVTGSGDIQSKMKFQDIFVHVEYMTPVVQASDTGATGQNRGNSGVYLKGSYEMQVLDTYGMPLANDGCGAIYGIKAPDRQACFMGGQWNTYEIEFKANTCNAQGQKTGNARIVKATLNGMIVHENVEVTRTTTGGQTESCEPKGLLLQDHSSFKPVIYRNIYVIPRN